MLIGGIRDDDDVVEENTNKGKSIEHLVHRFSVRLHTAHQPKLNKVQRVSTKLEQKVCKRIAPIGHKQLPVSSEESQ